MALNLTNNPCWPCSNCCKGSMIRIKDEDILRWKDEERYDIILCLEEITSGAAFMIHKKNDECIFLDTHGCLIYTTRPEVCRLFPRSKKHAEEFNCRLKDNLEKVNDK